MHRYFEINEHGHNIRCKLYYQDLRNIRKAVIFFHGFGGHKDNGAAEKFAERLLSKHKGVAMVTFNWPCHGDDVKKKLTLEDCEAYLSLVTDHVRQKLGAEDLYAYATSFGGYLVLKYISELGNPFRKILLRCPALDLYDAMTRRIMQPGDLEKLQRVREIPVGFDRKVPVSLSFLKEIRENDVRTRDYLDWAEDILILHGTADEIIPFEIARDFSENSLIDLVAVEGADHRFRDPRKMEQAIKSILEFFAL